MTNETRDREQTLWALTELDDPATSQGREPALPSSVPDELLIALMDRSLGPAERRRVEALLLRDPEARRRLLTLADPVPAERPSDVRQALIEQFGRQQHEVVPKSPRQRYGWVALAAVLLTAVAAGIFLRPQPLPPPYDVAIQGLQVTRQDSTTANQDTASTEATAFSDTQVSVRAVVRGAAQGDVDVGLYRESGETLTRIPEQAGLVRETWQGVTLLHASAEVLVGSEPGVHQLFLVVARRNELPPILERPDSLNAGAATAVDSGRRFHRLILRLQTPISSVQDAARTLREEATHAMAERTFAYDRLPALDRPRHLRGQRRGAIPT